MADRQAGAGSEEPGLRDRLADALSFVPAHDRDIWIRCGMGLHEALGQHGFALWDSWSQSAENYDPREARTQWRSFKAGGGITAGSVLKLARANGWQGDGRLRPKTGAEIAAAERRRHEERERRKVAAEKVAAEAACITDRLITPPLDHPYLRRKALAGLSPARDALIYWPGGPTPFRIIERGDLILPLRLFQGAVISAQVIKPDGAKRFLPGGMVKGTSFRLLNDGPPTKIAVCEGFATAASVAATGLLFATFAALSAQFIPVVAGLLRRSAPLDTTILIVADNDKSGVGAHYARRSGCQWWMPERVGEDANDLHCRAGLGTLTALLAEALAS